MRRCPTFLLGLLVAGWLAGPAGLASAAPPPEYTRQFEQTVAKGLAYLESKGQSDDGAYSPQSGPGVTAIVVTAQLRSGLTPDTPVVARGLKYLEGLVQPDGGVYQPGSTHRNYETCLAILCFSEANRRRRYDEQLRRADAFVKGIQWGKAGGVESSDFAYGGAGYGHSRRPDLSNTSFLMDALRATGNKADSDAVQAALAFVSRCQNLESEHNTTPFAAKNPDGGFYYTPASGGASMAGNTDNGGLRSYGSMTYAGLKSMIFAGVGGDDPRVKAAVAWIRKHYDLKSNPGMGQAGLYYYYHTFAKALDAMPLYKVTSDDGVAHDWRAELLAELASRQRADGSWLNENDRWLEGDPNLVTAYALLALSYCQPQRYAAAESR